MIKGAELEEGEEEKCFRGCRGVRALIRYDPSIKKGVFPWEKASLILA